VGNKSEIRWHDMPVCKEHFESKEKFRLNICGECGCNLDRYPNPTFVGNQQYCEPCFEKLTPHLSWDEAGEAIQFNHAEKRRQELERECNNSHGVIPTWPKRKCDYCHKPFTLTDGEICFDEKKNKFKCFTLACKGHRGME